MEPSVKDPFREEGSFFGSALLQLSQTMTNRKLKLNLESKPTIPAMEEAVLAYWDETDAFKKSVDLRPAKNPYVFYDGPPFATGLPHYGHILSSTAKDVIPRYFTMRGFRVERVWGWDCHGIPIENMIEQELGLQGGKKGIEELGIAQFNAACRAAILKFDQEWESIIKRIGRWVDFKNSYKTMDKSFMESVWWAFKKLHDSGLVYQGRKVILYCPRCATPLSNFEIAMDNSYKVATDNSVYVAFELHDNPGTYFLAWTTTPWTLLGNVALAIDPQAEYVKVKLENTFYWLANNRLSILPGKYQVVEQARGASLLNISYKPLYPYMDTAGKRAHYTVPASFVSLEEGTGIVHTAALYGEEDYQLAIEHDLPLVDSLDESGKFLPHITPLAGLFYKKAETWVIDDLTRRNLLLKKEKIEHSYPFCYRCGTPLYYNAVPAWFINIQKLKPRLIEANEKINWFPSFLKEGRFKHGLESAPDWNISRSRYWGTPMPVWIGEHGIRIIGSLEELRHWAVRPEEVDKLTDIHREHVDSIEVYVDEDRKEIGKRIPEVFDCWIESGSMPYASIHYPFDNKDKFEASYPAQFISEYIAQTRAWFYTLHVLSVGLFGEPSFTNVVTTGTIQAEDGTKMSKSKKNYPDPMLLINRYGVDAMRHYLMSSVVMKAENLNFSEKSVDEVYKKLILIFFNNLVFYLTYCSEGISNPPNADGVLDAWMLSRLNTVTRKMTEAYDNYNTPLAGKLLLDFVQETSTWYIRLSRDRLRTKGNGAVLGYVLSQTALLAAPMTPFIAEFVYQNIAPAKLSVHHEDWPTANAQELDEKLEEEMTLAQEVVEKGRSERKSVGIRTRQPLAHLAIVSPSSLSEDVLELVKQELNVKEITLSKGSKLTASLDTHLTPELIDEGLARDIMRDIQAARKKAGLKPHEQARIFLPSWPDKFTEEIKQKVSASELLKGDELRIELIK